LYITRDNNLKKIQSKWSRENVRKDGEQIFRRKIYEKKIVPEKLTAEKNIFVEIVPVPALLNYILLPRIPAHIVTD